MIVQQNVKSDTMDNLRAAAKVGDYKYVTKEESIVCGICHQVANRPTIFSCQHLFCTVCSENHYRKLNFKYFVLCPICGESTSISKPWLTANDVSNDVFIDTPKAMASNGKTFRSDRANELIMMENLESKKGYTCDLCIDKRLADARCVDCSEFMCTFCHNSHRKSKASKHHQTKLLVQMDCYEEHTCNDAASSGSSSETNSKQDDNQTTSALEVCTEHDTVMTYFCRPCQTLVCKECRLSQHKGHRTKPFKTLLGDRRKQLQDRMEKIQLGKYEALQERLISVSQQMAEIRHASVKTEHEINQQAEQLKQNIDDIKSNVTLDLKTKEEHALSQLENTQTEIQRELMTINECLKSSQNILNSATDLELVTESKDLIENMQTILDEETLLQDEKITITFEAGQLPTDVLRNGFGYCSIRNCGSRWSRSVSVCIGEQCHVSIRLLAHFDCTTLRVGDVDDNDDDHFSCDCIHAMTSLSSGQAILCCDWGSSVVLTTDQQGHVLQSINIGSKIDDITRGSGHEIYLSSYREKSITKIENGEVTDLITTPFYPRGLTKTNDGGIVVCMVDDYTTSVTRNSKRLLMKLKFTEDDKKARFEDFGDNSTRLFTRPFRVAENINGDICVTDKTSMGAGRLVVLGQSGQLKCVYNGLSSSVGGRPFSPAGLCCDYQGRILVADTNNNCVHILDKRGQFIGFLLTKDDGIQCPTCLTLSNDNQLWIANDYGEVRVYYYL